MRPIGHITDNIRELEQWKEKRQAKALHNAPLETAILLLIEYRNLLNQTDPQYNATTWKH